MTLPIGGADMPVVISIYNAATGLAVGLEGFVLGNPALMIAGMVVGAAGTLLTLLMAQAMNRSVANVLFTNFGGAPKHKPGHIKGSLKPTAAADAGIFMRYAKSVIIVPGYGLAAAQGQQKLYEFVKLLQAADVSVKFAIHPVAGRMPGQMDVLLAEAGVPYDLIFQLDDINEEFKTTDVALVIGANDVVNPAARTDKSSPIFRHADPQRRPGQAGLCRQARSGQRLRRHRQRPFLRRQLQHGLRRRRSRADEDDRGRARVGVESCCLIGATRIKTGFNKQTAGANHDEEDAGRVRRAFRQAAGDHGG